MDNGTFSGSSTVEPFCLKSTGTTNLNLSRLRTVYSCLHRADAVAISIYIFKRSNATASEMPGLLSFSLLFIALLLPCQSVPSIVTNRKGYISRAAVQKQFPKFFKHLNQSTARRTYLAERQSSNNASSTSEQSKENRPRPKGYNFDPCSYHRDCFGARYCIRADWASACSGAISCICMGDMLQVCNIKCNECENYPEETCGYLTDDAKNGINNGTCVSAYLIYEGILVERGCDSFPDSTPLPAVEQSVYNWSYQGQANTAPYSSGSGTNTGQTESASPSHPVSPQDRDDSEETTPGTDPHNVPYSSGSNSSSTEPASPHSHSPSPSSPPQGSDDSKDMMSGGGDSGDGCIDAKALAHLKPSQLVYNRHMRRGVLCDAFGSCATPGHMVVHRGKAMSMRTYCASVQSGGCSQRVMNVNSPRYSRSLRLRSRTADVQYTAFAARYESEYEERLLCLAIHSGL